MKRIDLSRDVIPVSDLRKRTASVLDAVQRGGRPVLITQNGRGAAVLLPVDVYERLLDEAAEFEAIEAGLRDADTGRTIAHAAAMRQLAEEFGFDGG